MEPKSRASSAAAASFPSALLRLSDLFAAPILEAEGCILLTLERDPWRHLSSFPGDPVGFEAFVNHVHLEDVLASDAGRPGRADLMRVGLRILQVWAERLRPVLRGREVLFYLGGRSGVEIRLHVARGDRTAWLDLDDRAFLAKSRMKVFRLSEAGLSAVGTGGGAPAPGK